MTIRGCGHRSVFATTHRGEVVCCKLYCKRWDCESCGRYKTARFIKRVLTRKPTTMMTLTCNPSLYDSWEDAFHAMSLAVNKLFKRLRRRFPRADIEYVLVWEQTKAGWPHIHALLVLPFLPQAVLSKLWFELTGAPIVDIRACDSAKQGARYVAKYLAKEVAAPARCKRYRFSYHWPKLERKVPLRDLLNTSKFSPDNYPLEHLAERLQQIGWLLDYMSPGVLIARPPPNNPLA